MQRIASVLFFLLAAVVSAGAAEAPLPEGLYAEFVMPRGSVIAQLHYQRAPLTVTSFVGLAEGTLAPRGGHSFYTGLKWYRVVPNFVIQSGDPTWSPTKPDDDESGHPYSFPDEFAVGLHHDAAGVLSMANAGPDTNSSEFFITLRDTNRLNYLHSVFGRVVRGGELLEKIQPNEAISAIKILRIGKAATEFRADQGALDGLLAKAKKYAGDLTPGPKAHFDDPDHLLPSEPPRARGFNFKLANFERATGLKIYGRVMAKFIPETPGQKPGAFVASLARNLGIAQDAILAVYFADTQQWSLWIPERHLGQFVSHTGDVTLHDAKKAFLAAAKTQAEAYTAEAIKAAPADKPVTAAQRIKYSVDAVLDALIMKIEPRE